MAVEYRDEYRVGDIVELSCPFTEAQVRELTEDEVLVEWPWRVVDPDSAGPPWNGTVAVAAGPDAPGWDRELFRIRPIEGEPAAGEPCHIGIPATIVRIVEVRQFDPPRDTGWLPRPRREIAYVRPGQPDPHPHRAPTFDPDDRIPYRIELLFRPYAFLEPGDEVADAAARVWRFNTAWDWHPFDTRPGTTPTWPLMLLTRHGDSGDDSAAVDVGEATITGSHHEELAKWVELAGLDPEPTPELERDARFDDTEFENDSQPDD
ncbi:hypothetical protein, partial [Nocardia sp. NPDC004722]